MGATGREMRYLLEQVRADGRREGVTEGKAAERSQLLAFLLRRAPKDINELRDAINAAAKGEHEKEPLPGAGR